MYDLCLDYMVKKYTDRFLGWELIEADAAVWDAVTVYQHTYEGSSENRYLVCYPDKIIDIRFSWEATPEQLKTAGEKLKDL